MKIRFVVIVALLTVIEAFGQISNYVWSNDVNIHYQVLGEGPAVIVINGGPGFSSEGFHMIASEIAELGYQTVLFDQRGTGKSSMSNLNSEHITMDLMVDDIEAIRDALDIDSWIVFGHSFGGMLANYYASKHPECVRAMIQSSSGGMDLSILKSAQNNVMSKLTKQEKDSMNYWRKRMINDRESEYFRRKYNQFLASAYVFDKTHVLTVGDRLMQGDYALNSLVWDDLSRINFDCKDELKSFAKPVLIIQGDNDVVPKSLAQKAAAIYPDARIIILEDCGHYGWLDQRKLYLQCLETFLEGV